MSVMSDLHGMVTQEGARTAEDFVRLGIEPKRADLLAEVVENSIPAKIVSVDAARLIDVLERQAITEVIVVTDEPDLPDFYWEDER